MSDAWMARAACRDSEGDIYFEQDLWPRALAACVGCPVVAHCLGFSVAQGAGAGLWAGMTPGQRAVAISRLKGLGYRPSELGGAVDLALLDDFGMPADESPAWVHFMAASTRETLGYIRVSDAPVSISELPRRLTAPSIAKAWIYFVGLSPDEDLHYEMLRDLLLAEGFLLPGKDRKAELRNVYTSATGLTRRGRLQRTGPGRFRAARLDDPDRTVPPWVEMVESGECSPRMPVRPT